jgi:protein TonB
MSSLPVRKTGAFPSAGEVTVPLPPLKEKELANAAAAARSLLQRKLEEIVVLTRESTNADGVAVALRENGKFLCKASQGYAPEPGIVVEPGQGVCGRCIIDARVLVCQDLSGDVKSAVAAPVIVGDEIEGLLASFSFRTAAFTSEHIDLVSRVAVDIGNMVASPDTIHLVPRDPVSILDDPRVDVIAIDEEDPSAREKHLEVLDAVTTPAISTASTAQESTVAHRSSLPFRFMGYDESAPPEPEALPATDELLGEYLSKWDIAVIFGAVLIAMLAFSLWLHHKRASQPYVAPYTSQSEPASSPNLKSASVPRPQTPAPGSHSTHLKNAATTAALSISGGRTGFPNGEEVQPPPVDGPTTTISSIALPASSANISLAPAEVKGPNAPAELVHKVDPVYPNAARAANEGGIVTLDLQVSRQGRIGSVKVVKGNDPFVASALGAVRQWRYEPAVHNGTKIDSHVRVDIAFNPR